MRKPWPTGLLLLFAACSDSTKSIDDTPVNVPARTYPDGGIEAGTSAEGGAVPVPVQDCPTGSTLVKKIACPGTATTAPASVASGLGGAPGSIVGLDGFAEPSAPCLPAAVCAPADAPTLLFSDSPESPRSDGVLYADTLQPGKYRIYVYHANGDTAVRKFPITVLNPSAAAASVKITRSGQAPPSTDYVAEGKAVLVDWLTPKPITTVVVGSGQRILLDPDLDARHASQNQLVHAIYDVTTTATLKFSIASVLATADAAATTGGLGLLPRDADHQRGTFTKADVILAGTAPAGVSRLRLGADEVDPILVGKDATTGDVQRLTGNYGLLYRVQIAGGLAGITPRGGAWGGAMTFATGTPVSLPSAQNTIAEGAVVLGAVTDVRLMTGGGSSLPVDLFVVR